MAIPGTFTLYNDFKLAFQQGGVNLGSDVFKWILGQSGSNAGVATMDPATYANMTSETPGNNGYTATGQAVTPSLSGNNSNPQTTFTTSNPTWTASANNSITARFGVLNDVTANKLVGFFVLDSTPADVSVSNGTPLIIQPGSSGLFQAG